MDSDLHDPYIPEWMEDDEYADWTAGSDDKPVACTGCRVQLLPKQEFEDASKHCA